MITSSFYKQYFCECGIIANSFESVKKIKVFKVFSGGDLSFIRFKATYKHMKRLILPLILLSVTPLTACTPVSAVRGNLVEDYQLKEVLPGIDGKDDVIRKIGSPTTISTFDENTWYYMGQKTKKKGILDPKVVEEKIIEVSFNADGKVANVVERKDGRQNIPIVQRTTPVSGNDFTFVQQMLVNVGKFNKQDEGAIATSGNR